MCKCKYYEISDYANVHFGDREKGMFNLQASTAQWVGAPWGEVSLPWAGRVPSQPAPAHPLQGTAGCENALKEGQGNATKAEEEGKNLWEVALQTARSDKRETDGVPQMPKQIFPCRDHSRAEGISCRNWGPRKVHTTAGLTWRTPVTGSIHSRGKGPSGGPLSIGEKRGKEQREWCFTEWPSAHSHPLCCLGGVGESGGKEQTGRKVMFQHLSLFLTPKINFNKFCSLSLNWVCFACHVCWYVLSVSLSWPRIFDIPHPPPAPLRTVWLLGKPNAAQ